MYRVVITDIDGTPIGEIVNYLSIIFEKNLNNFGTCEVTVSLNEPNLAKLISLRKYQTLIYKDNLLVWAGEQVYRKGQVDDLTQEPVSIISYDYLELFNHRYTNAIETYTSIDAGAIAWDLIDKSQSIVGGDFGITQGTINTTQDRDRVYYNQNIMEAIINLSNVIGGFDFEITNYKVFNVWQRKGNDRSSTILFEYGKNMSNISIEEDFTNPINEAIVLGEGFGATQLRETYTNALSISAYGLRQGRFQDTDISDTNTLYAMGEEYVRIYKQRLQSITFKQVQNTEPRFGTLSLGDSIKIKVNKGIYNLNNVYRIYGWTVKIDQDGNEDVEYLVSFIS